MPCLVKTKLADLIKAKGAASLSEVKRVLSLICSELDESSPPTTIATKVYREVKAISRNSDPYKDFKLKHIKAAKLLRDRALEDLSKMQDGDRLLYAVRLSLLGNALDTGVAGYIPPTLESLEREADRHLILNDVKYLNSMVRPGVNILYLLDNAGEAVLDCALAKVLKDRGARVVAVVKNGSFQDDITVHEVQEAELWNFFNGIVSSGNDSASVLQEVSDHELRKELQRSDMLISKGMANYEYLSDPPVLKELKRPVFFMLRAKCQPVASSLGLGKSDFVIKLVKSY